MVSCMWHYPDKSRTRDDQARQVEQSRASDATDEATGYELIKTVRGPCDDVPNDEEPQFDDQE